MVAFEVSGRWQDGKAKMAQGQRKNDTMTECGLDRRSRPAGILTRLSFRDTLQLFQESFPSDCVTSRLPRGVISLAGARVLLFLSDSTQDPS